VKFPNIEMFREAIRVYNVKKGKDIKFKRSERMRCVCVCRDARYKYRVYGRKMRDEESFQVRSMQPRYICGRKYRNTIVNSTWIAQKLFDKFRVQPNMPLDAIQHEVNDKWHVDVNPSTSTKASTSKASTGKEIHIPHLLDEREHTPLPGFADERRRLSPTGAADEGRVSPSPGFAAGIVLPPT
jgi:hypothetical protein